ncbi:MAG: peptide ABC transporter substrate-binding protein [Pyrinomonadaceae bacterium]
MRMNLNRFPSRLRFSLTSLLLVALSIAPSGCFTGQTYEAYYGSIIVPREQGFRWIDGTLPQTFDPAFAAAPPDTDLVRALFEGLTDYDPQTLAPVPAVAKHWESANDGRTWTFYLRENARWSNGDAVVAKDFVDSWRRTMRIGDLAPHTDLLSNIVGSAAVSVPEVPARNSSSRGTRANSENPITRADARFGAEAVDEHVLRVRLQVPDLNFPALVAHPVFRPIKVAPENTLKRIDATGLVSNGAFLLTQQDKNRVLLQRADNYWARNEVALERVEFIGANNAEAALAAYRAGEVDAVTNSAFEPLALKLLAPYQDFRRETYGALTYYSFNVAHEPFDDVRVREALAIAIDRERLAQDDMGGATEPAKKFLPELKTESAKVVVSKTELLELDAERARELLAEAGYPDGRGFPVVRLLINRNEQQRLIANSIAQMWRSILNIEIEISIKGWDEYEAAISAGEYDVVRRGMVMQTTDELTNIRALFQPESQPVASPANATTAASGSSGTARERLESPKPSPLESEADALKELRAIPLYFASSHALVKPYVTGFDSNLLDAPSLRRVRIETNWTAPKNANSGR